MTPTVRKKLQQRKQGILRRPQNPAIPELDQPMMTAASIHYELAERVSGLAPGGIGAMHLLARGTGSIRDIDARLHLLKRHLPY